MNPSDRHSQHPPPALVPHHFSQLLQAHPPFTRPSSPPPLSARQHHLFHEIVHPHHVPEITRNSRQKLSILCRPREFTYIFYNQKKSSLKSLTTLFDFSGGYPCSQRSCQSRSNWLPCSK